MVISEISDQEFDIPAPGTTETENVINNYAIFVNTPVQGCTLRFELFNQVGGNAPSYYTINEFSGQITAAISGDARVDDQLIIVINAEGGRYPVR